MPSMAAVVNGFGATPLRIELSQPYKSIAALTTEDLPDFAILIGRNGAGKTQLLEALKEGRAAIPCIGADEIERYDMGSFRPPNANEANRQTNQFAQLTADAYLLSPPDGQAPINTAADIFCQCTAEIERDSGVDARDDFVRNLRNDIQQVPDFTVFAATNRGSTYKELLYQQVLRPLISVDQSQQGRRQPNQSNISFNGNQAALISTAMKLTSKLPHELTQDDIQRASHYEGNTLTNSVSAVFVAYKVNQFTWAHKRIETERVTFADLISEYRTVYPSPWQTLREILSTMRDEAGEYGLFDFDFSDPDGYELHMGNFEQFSFKAEMTNRTTGAQYELGSLSSGEKVLMALCLASFNQYLGRRFPKLLLLDEIDAVLHPSMVAALVRTLKDQFVPRGIRVLMTSHSPMTMATLDDADIFSVVRTGGDVTISHTTKSEAITELSEGLATVDVGLRIAASNEAKVTILTEGHNTKHLKKWVELYFPKDIYVFEGLEQHSNDDNLLAYGRLLTKVTTNTHFVIVWDCDATAKADALRKELPPNAKVTPYTFPCRQDNAIAPRGIENNYDEAILQPYSTQTTRGDGTLLARGFDGNSKLAFADHVLREGTTHYFTNFQGLRKIVSDILEGQQPASPNGTEASSHLAQAAHDD